MTRQEQIDNVMDWFDFNKVVKTMVALDWKWFSAEDGTPSEPEIRISARKRLNEVYDHYEKTGEEWRIGTGGLEVSITLDGTLVELSLKFIVSEWCCWSDDEEDE